MIYIVKNRIKEIIKIIISGSQVVLFSLDKYGKMLKIIGFRKLYKVEINGKQNIIFRRGVFNYEISEISHLDYGENILVIKSRIPFLILRKRNSKRIKKKEKFISDNYYDYRDKFHDLINRNFGQNYGLFFTGYDFSSNTYRLNSWIWSNAIPFNLLLEDYKTTKDQNIKNILESVISNIYDRRLTSWIEGLYVVRWDIDSSNKVNPLIAPNDLSILASKVFLDYYKTFNVRKYLDLAISIADWIISSGTDENGLVYSGYSLLSKEFAKNWLYVDSGFTASFFVNLFEVTNKSIYKDYAIHFAHSFIKRFSYNGLYRKTATPNGDNNTLFARGQAWALDGLISVYTLTRDKVIESNILNAIDELMKYQNEDGSWNYVLNKPKWGIGNKATPIIAYQLKRFNAVYKTNRDDIINTISSAIAWCTKNIYVNEDYIGISGYNIEGSIVGKRNNDTALTYSLAYYLLTRFMNLEEENEKNNY